MKYDVTLLWENISKNCVGLMSLTNKIKKTFTDAVEDYKN